MICLLCKIMSDKAIRALRTHLWEGPWCCALQIDLGYTWDWLRVRLPCWSCNCCFSSVILILCVFFSCFCPADRILLLNERFACVVFAFAWIRMRIQSQTKYIRYLFTSVILFPSAARFVFTSECDKRGLLDWACFLSVVLKTIGRISTFCSAVCSLRFEHFLLKHRMFEVL